METVFVSVIDYGKYDENQRDIIYAGLDYNFAREIASTTRHIDWSKKDVTNYTWVEHWQNGKMIKHEYAYDG